MIDDIRHGIRNCGRTPSALARATNGRVSERTIYGLMSEDANPTIKTLDALADVLGQLHDKQNRPCDGCRHMQERDRLDFGEGETDVVICRFFNEIMPDRGCALRRPAE